MLAPQIWYLFNLEKVQVDLSLNVCEVHNPHSYEQFDVIMSDCGLISKQ